VIDNIGSSDKSVIGCLFVQVNIILDTAYFITFFILKKKWFAKNTGCKPRYDSAACCKPILFEYKSPANAEDKTVY
jgi:hypothetical protein